MYLTRPEGCLDYFLEGAGLGIIGFLGFIGFIGLLGLIGFIGFLGFIGFIGCIGFIGFIGFIGCIGFIGFIGFIDFLLVHRACGVNSVWVWGLCRLRPRPKKVSNPHLSNSDPTCTDTKT